MKETKSTASLGRRELAPEKQPSSPSAPQTPRVPANPALEKCEQVPSELQSLSPAQMDSSEVALAAAGPSCVSEQDMEGAGSQKRPSSPSERQDVESSSLGDDQQKDEEGAPRSDSSTDVSLTARRVAAPVLKEGGQTSNPRRASVLDERRARAQQELAQAMEDHDAPKLRQALSEAKAAGLAQSDLEGAQRILNFEVQDSMLYELDGVRAAVASLAKAVEAAEARARQAEQRAEEAHAAFAATKEVTGDQPVASQANPNTPPSEVSKSHFSCSSSFPQSRLCGSGGGLEDQLWKKLEHRIGEAVSAAVSRATRELSEVVSMLSQVRIQPALPVAAAAQATATAGSGGFASRHSRHSCSATSRIVSTMRCAPPEKREPSNAPNGVGLAGFLPATAAAIWRLRTIGAAAPAQTSAECDPERQPARMSLRLAYVGAAQRTFQPQIQELERRSLAGAVVRRSLYGAADVLARRAGPATDFGIDTRAPEGKKDTRSAASFVVRAAVRSSLTGTEPMSPTASQKKQVCFGAAETANSSEATAYQCMSSISACLQQMEAAKAEAEERIGGASVKLQAAERGRQARKQLCRRRTAGLEAAADELCRTDKDLMSSLARASNLLEESWMLGSIEETLMTVASKVPELRAFTKEHRRSAVQKTIRTTIFNVAGGTDAGLDQKGLRIALCQLELQVSEKQVAALWKTFMNSTQTAKVDVEIFERVAKAITPSSASAAKAADLSEEAWTALNTGHGNSADNATEEMRPLHIDREQVLAAIDQVAPEFNRTQVESLWTGYSRGTGQEHMNLADFKAMLEAATTGEHEAAEFADMSAEAFSALGVEGGEDAARRLQALQRGRVVRKELKKQQEASRTIQRHVRNRQKSMNSEPPAS